jgi:hypothetical protein
MNLTSLLFAAMAAYTQADDSQRGLETIAQKWNIREPSLIFENLTFNLTFGVSDYIKGDLGMVKYTVWDENCESGTSTDTDDAVQIWDSATGVVSGQNGVLSVVDNVTSLLAATTTETSGLVVPTGGNSMQDVAINITLDSSSIRQNSDIYTEDTTTIGAVTAEIRFCFRFELHTPNNLDIDPFEVNFLETIVTLSIDLSDTFDITGIDVAVRDIVVRTANINYGVRAYQCHDNLEELTPNEKLVSRGQGSIIKVCITPDADASDDGIFMRSIDSFAVYSTSSDTISQDIIVNNAAATNQLTSYDSTLCKGSVVCYFSTIFYAGFYTSAASQVAGSGIATMQYGSNRRLRSGDDRNLQDDDAGEAEFEFEFRVVKATETSSPASSIGAILMTGLWLALSGVAALM